MAIKLRIRTRFKFPLNSLSGIFIILTSKRRFPVTKIEITAPFASKKFHRLNFQFCCAVVISV